MNDLGPRTDRTISILLATALTLILGVALLPAVGYNRKISSEREKLAQCRELRRRMCAMVQWRLVPAQEIARRPFELESRKADALASLQEVLSYAPSCIQIPAAASRALRDAAARGGVTPIALAFAIDQVARELDAGARAGWPPPGGPARTETP